MQNDPREPLMHYKNAQVANITMHRIENAYAITEEDLQLIQDHQPEIVPESVDLPLFPRIYTPEMASLDKKASSQKKVLVERGNNIEPTLDKNIRVALAVRQRGSRCRRCRR